MPKLRTFLILASALATSPALAQTSEASQGSNSSDDSFVQLGIGLDYSEGDYGDVSKTKVTSAPVGIKYVRGGFSIRVSTSYVRIAGPGALLTTTEGAVGAAGVGNGNSGSGSSGSGSGSSGSGSSNSGSGSSGSSGGSGNSGSGSSGSGGGSSNSGSGSSGSGGGSGNSGSGSSGSSGGGGPAGGATGTATSSTSGGVIVIPGGGNRRDSGMGDTNVTLNYSFDLDKGLYLDLTGKVKLPTASRAKGLGTGKVDFVTAAALSKDIGAANIYVEGRRRFAGSSLARPIRDTWGISTGVSGTVSDGVRLGADYDWQQASFTGGKASSEVTGWASFRLSRQFRLQVYATAGLNKASVGSSGGVALTYRFYGL